ncbi:MAG: FtsX-like permease family protein [Myxococcota bacterium]
MNAFLPGIAWRNLWRNKRRTLLTLSAIAFGSFLAVLYTALQDRNYADMIDTAAKLGGGHVLVEHPEYLDTPTLTRTVEHTDQIRALAEADPNVRTTVVRITGQAMVATATRNLGVGFIAYDAASEDDTTLSFLRGIEGDLADPKGVVVGSRVAKNLQVGLGDKVVYTLVDRSGQIVSGLGRVTGIVRTGAASVDGALMLLPIDAIRGVIGYAPDEATMVSVYLNDSRRSTAVAERLGAQLGGVGSAGDTHPVALPWSVAQPDLAGLIALKVGGARFLELVILVLVAAGIFNTLFMSVMERRREFGILAAIGCSRPRIFSMVMWESTWLALVGIVAAVAVTAWPYAYLSTHGIPLGDEMQQLEVAGMGMPSVLRVGIYPESALMIAGFAVGATLLAGLWPAWQASRVPPVEAIKMV